MSLTVTAVLCSPRGHPRPVAHAPTPSAQYVDQRATASGSGGLKVGVAQVGGGLSRPVGAEELVIDVTGDGTAQLIWVVIGRHRELAGTYEFGFVVREAARYAWVEVTAQLEVVKGKHFFRTPVVPGDAVLSVAPLIDNDAPQAGITLTLYQGNERFFVGRPLDLPLAVAPDGFTVARGRGAAVTGWVRWADDVGGRAGYTWVQESPSPVVQVGDSPLELRRRTLPVLIEPGSDLRAAGAMSLTASYDIARAPEWAVANTVGPVLEMDVVVDGAVAGTHTTQADYVTVGRTHRDICIDRPEISRSHGAFQLGPSGWAYCHQSLAADAQVVRGDRVIATVRQGGRAAVGPGDVVRLTSKVSLVLR